MLDAQFREKIGARLGHRMQNLRMTEATGQMVRIALEGSLIGGDRFGHPLLIAKRTSEQVVDRCHGRAEFHQPFEYRERLVRQILPKCGLGELEDAADLGVRRCRPTRAQFGQQLAALRGEALGGWRLGGCHEGPDTGSVWLR